MEITWKPEPIHDLNPAPLFDMTRYICEYAGGMLQSRTSLVSENAAMKFPSDQFKIKVIELSRRTLREQLPHIPRA